MWGFLENNDEFKPSDQQMESLLKLYPDWEQLEYKPTVDEVEPALALTSDITDPSDTSVGTFQDIIEADKIHCRPLDESLGSGVRDSEVMDVKEKCANLRSRLSPRDLETLCRGTLVDLVRETFKAKKVSLQIFQLYMEVLPASYEPFLNKLFRLSFGLDRCGGTLKEYLQLYAPSLQHDYKNFNDFRNILQSLPKLSEILRTNVRLEKYSEAPWLMLETSYHKILFPIIKKKLWRNLSGQIFFDRNVGGLYVHDDCDVAHHILRIYEEFGHLPDWDMHEKPLNFFRAAVMLAERNFPDAPGQIKRYGDGIEKSKDGDAIKYRNEILVAILGTLKPLYDMYDAKQKSTQRSEQTYKDLDLPSLHKLKRADLYHQRS
ncbi:hypothetical protein BGW37DRAFT_553748 [Umbelopsis sp. PMI_123]|nr:hypothetical protein BGW37DRAFT_553748 [Umbelopsis sp. PMI_123]